MKNSASHTLSKLNAFSMDLVSSSIAEDMLEAAAGGGGGGTTAVERTPSMKLLVKFQRLLLAELYSSGPDDQNEDEQVKSELNPKKLKKGSDPNIGVSHFGSGSVKKLNLEHFTSNVKSFCLQNNPGSVSVIIGQGKEFGTVPTLLTI